MLCCKPSLQPFLLLYSLTSHVAAVAAATAAAVILLYIHSKLQQHCRQNLAWQEVQQAIADVHGAQHSLG